MHPSRQVLDALARALRFTAAADPAQLHETAQGQGTVATREASEVLAPSVVAWVERLDPYPTYVTGRRFDVLAANEAVRALWTDWPALPADERSMSWWVFTDPAARIVPVEWEAEASALLARFRAAAHRHPDEPGFATMINRPQSASREARAWWPCHDIVPFGSAPNSCVTPYSAR